MNNPKGRNLATLLRYKNLLVQEISRLHKRIDENNSHPASTEPPYNSRELFNTVMVKVTECIQLKTMIHEMSAPIRSKIFQVSELKALIANYRSLNCRTGKIGYGVTVEEYVSTIGVIDRDQLLAEWEKEIEKLQIEIDQFNVNTFEPRS